MAIGIRTISVFLSRVPTFYRRHATGSSQADARLARSNLEHIAAG